MVRCRLKQWVRLAFAKAGYRVTRLRPANRFQAADEALILMRNLGYSPRVIVDAGANVGDWTRMARSIFPKAHFHLIEPQPACVKPLKRLLHSAEGLTYHAVALTKPGTSRVRMIGGGDAGGGTGAWIARPGERALGEVECPATTLDALLADRVTRKDRALLKLDLEGHEIAALTGGERVLISVEVVLTELQFYEINNNGFPVFSDMIRFLGDRGFELYDFASLSQRPRDMRLRMGDVVFVRKDSPLVADRSWE